MIDPQYQWAIQIDITNSCVRECSNCTRFIGHWDSTYYMTTEFFEKAVLALRDFPTQSPPTSRVKHKVIGILGGEPLIHPQIKEIFAIFEALIPARENRGLWTSLQWQKTKHAKDIERIFGYINNNLHRSNCEHSPILVSISSQVNDEKRKNELIENCWLQEMWSSTVTPGGFYFCEVAAFFDMLTRGDTGLPVEEGCWRRPLSDFKAQMQHCNRCGIPLQLPGRKDVQNLDDISEDNLELLKNSARIRQGKYVLHTKAEGWDDKPWQYLR